MEDIFKYILGLCIAIIGFFLRVIYNDLRDLIKNNHDNENKFREDIGKLKGNMELLDKEYKGRLELLSETTKLELQQLTRITNNLNDTTINLANSINSLNKAVIQMSSNLDKKENDLYNILSEIKTKLK